ncbi:MAG: flagellar basal body-associated FliL family protein [Pseudomonadota bacterium]
MASNSIDDQASSDTETSGRWVAILILFLVVVGLPLLVMNGASWLDVKPTISPPRPAPNWVMPELIKATTSDGTIVTAKVAIDVADSASRTMFAREGGQLVFMLQVVLAARSEEELTSKDGLEQLSKDLRRQVNGYLKAQDLPPVKSVVVQDLFLIKS